MHLKDLYQKAENFLPWKLKNFVLNTTISPYWSKQAVYYFQQKENDKLLIKLNPLNGKKETLFNYQQIVDSINTFEKIDLEQSLLISNFFIEEESENLFSFNYNNYKWQF